MFAAAPLLALPVLGYNVLVSWCCRAHCPTRSRRRHDAAKRAASFILTLRQELEAEYEIEPT